MRGLLIKDVYTLIKQMKVILLILVVFACIPGYSLAPFAVVYAAMLPITALAYDERSKWDELAVMMPYSTRNIVFSKYVLGAMSIACATVVSVGAQLLIGALRGEPLDITQLKGLIMLACMAFIILSINLPFMFRFGVEKGRIVFLILVCGGTVAAMALREQLLAAIEGMGATALVLAVLAALSLVITIISAYISVAIYKKRTA